MFVVQRRKKSLLSTPSTNELEVITPLQMASTTGEESSHEHTTPWSNTTIDEIEVIHVHIREVEKRRQEKVDKLSKSEARLAKIQGNRRKPARGSGKSQFRPYQPLKNLLTIFRQL